MFESQLILASCDPRDPLPSFLPVCHFPPLRPKASSPSLLSTYSEPHSCAPLVQARREQLRWERALAPSQHVRARSEGATQRIPTAPSGAERSRAGPSGGGGGRGVPARCHRAGETPRTCPALPLAGAARRGRGGSRRLYISGRAAVRPVRTRGRRGAGSASCLGCGSGWRAASGAAWRAPTASRWAAPPARREVSGGRRAARGGRVSLRGAGGVGRAEGCGCGVMGPSNGTPSPRADPSRLVLQTPTRPPCRTWSCCTTPRTSC